MPWFELIAVVISITRIGIGKVFFVILLFTLILTQEIDVCEVQLKATSDDKC